ncbi:hypothetical protein BDZ45DRAFT_727652 [Acephala macrosclerotiorum]|nr:hypothetical protein BDZ45DRAFT_727652 [Acephala macrosclerotiorum]
MIPSLPFAFSVSFLATITPVVHATTFNPNCTLPTSSTTFVASPNARGTLSILWNCLSIIILCTWNIQHLSIPACRSYYDKFGKKHGWARRTWWAIIDTRTGLSWMALTVLVPEYVMGRALSERLAAVSSLQSLKSRFGDEMEMVHAYIMNMGGYYLDCSEVGFPRLDASKANPSGTSGFGTTAVDYSGVYFSGDHVTELHAKADPPKPLEESDLINCAASTATKTFEHQVQSSIPTIESKNEAVQIPEHNSCFRVEACAQGNPTSKSLQTSTRKGHLQQPRIEGLARPVTSADPHPAMLLGLSPFQVLNLAHFRHRRWALTALQILRAKSFKLFDTLPEVPPRQLECLSNSDSLVKFLAIVQMAWLMIGLFVRYKQNIISSQLEVVTLAFSACSVVTYAILWDRPRGVTTRYRIIATKAANMDEILWLATFGPGYLWTWNRLEGKPDEELDLMPIPNDASHAVDVRNLVGNFEDSIFARKLFEWLRHHHPAVVSVIMGSVLGGTLFGGLHCLAWDFSFPTHAEVVLWRICAVATTVLPMLSVYFNLQWLRYNGWAEPERTMVQRLHGPALLLCFILPYILARLFLLVEMFRSLFYLPPEAFVDTWPGAFLLWG